jgi:Lrp/AsnC family transcriptional regulator
VWGVERAEMGTGTGMGMGELKLDAVDVAILAALQEDADLSNADLAARIGLSASPCWRRIQRLQQAGAIQRRVALLDAKRLGFAVVAFASVKLSVHGRQALPEFEAAIHEFPQVVECYTVTGEMDFILRILTRDIQSYERLLRDHLLQLPHVGEIHSTIALTQVKYTTRLPLDLLREG